ncbi:hypothetical protein [Bradyrhizobium sp. HKCCYLR20261]|uniref:hypothetical protein n=1 Tax=Bradyrhizobium sp. HKCCYLR20261 TaxID=3420760 RepID=UPI003EB7D0B5
MTIAKRPSSASRDARECAGDLPDVTSDKCATNWHDGQLAHAGHAGHARVARRPLTDTEIKLNRRVLSACAARGDGQHLDGDSFD